MMTPEEISALADALGLVTPSSEEMLAEAIRQAELAAHNAAIEAAVCVVEAHMYGGVIGDALSHKAKSIRPLKRSEAP